MPSYEAEQIAMKDQNYLKMLKKLDTTIKMPSEIQKYKLTEVGDCNVELITKYMSPRDRRQFMVGQDRFQKQLERKQDAEKKYWDTLRFEKHAKVKEKMLEAERNKSPIKKENP